MLPITVRTPFSLWNFSKSVLYFGPAGTFAFFFLPFSGFAPTDFARDFSLCTLSASAWCPRWKR